MPRIARQIEQNDLVPELSRLVGRKLQDLGLASRYNVPTSSKKKGQGLKNHQLRLAGTSLSAGQSVRNRRIEPETALACADDEARVFRRTLAVPEVVAAVQLRNAANNLRIAENTLLDLAARGAFLDDDIAKEEKEQGGKRDQGNR